MNKELLVAAVASTSTCVVLVGYILLQRRGQRSAAGCSKREAYLQKLCNSMQALPNEEWDKVQAKLDVFLGIAPPVHHVAPAAVAVVAAKSPTRRVQSPLKLPIKQEATKVKSPIKSPVKQVIVEAAVTAEDDSPELVKYRKMLKMGIPAQAVRNKMTTDGVNPALLFGENSEPAPLSAPAVRVAALPVPSTCILSLEPIPADALSEHSFWRSDQDTATVTRLDANVSLGIKALFHSKRKLGKRRTGNAGNENCAPNSTNAMGNAMNKSLIPPRRAQNIQIGLVKLKRTPEVLCAAILSMEEHCLDDLHLLQNILPTADEMKLVLAGKKDGLVLNTVDHFVDVVARQCKDARERVHCLLILKQSPCNEIALLVAEMTSLCALALAQSRGFARLLQAVSVVGAALNRTLQSPPTTTALSIHNLADALLAAKHGKFTAADLVVLQFKAQGGDCANLLEAFALGQNTLPTIATVETQIRLVEKDLAFCTQAFAGVPGLAALERELELLCTQVQALKDAFACVLEVFGEPKDRAFPIFFQDLLALVKCVETAQRNEPALLKLLAQQQQLEEA